MKDEIDTDQILNEGAQWIWSASSKNHPHLDIFQPPE